jgi:prolipoprotein diacylglyceryl transferase
MYPDLSYFFNDVFGTPTDNWLSIFKTFGLLLAFAFLASAYVLRLELIRKEKEGTLKPTIVKETENKSNSYIPILINAIIGFILGFKIPVIISDFNNFKHDPAGKLLSGDGNLFFGILVAAGFGAFSYWDSIRNKKDIVSKNIIHPYERTGDIIILAAISGLIGARLFSVLENLDSFFQDPLGQIFSGSGLTMYGGLIIAFFAVYYYVKKNGIPPIQIMDIAALAIVVGYGVGRLGCHFSGDGDWGIVNEMAKPSWFILPDWMWSYNYPHNVIKEGIPLENCSSYYCTQLVPGVFPTPVYETIMMGIIFILLWVLRVRLKIPGLLFSIFLILQGLERFFIEAIRVNPKYKFVGLELSQAQYISLGLIVIGIAGILYLKFKNHKPLTE